MAVAPLFVADMDTLKAKLRLTGVANADGVALIEEAVLQVRQEIYRRLGASKITTLLATAYTDTPATDDEYKRLVAANLEVKWVRLRLLDSMAVVFKDATGNMLEQWNEEAAFREGRLSQAEKRKAFQEILDDVRFLKSGTAGSEQRGNANLIEPDDAPPQPGDSVWGPYRPGTVPVLEE